MNGDSHETRPLWALNATELVSGYMAARFTPLDVIESVLERIDGVNPLVNAVVTSDVPANAIAVGVPARVIRLRTRARQHSPAAVAGKAGNFQ